jgi:hypothetical protein
MNTNASTTHTTGSELVAAIETFWAALVARHPELPSQVIVVTGSGRVQGGLIRGHWAADRWQVLADEVRAPELFVSGERIADGGRGVATTIIHEAAHALLIARGDRTGGTSRQGRYHTKSGFAATAIELGLVPPAKADAVLGFSDCTMPDETAEAFAAEIAALDEALGARIVMVDLAELIAAAIAVGAILGGLQVIVPWWKVDDVISMWGTLGGGVRRPAPRQTRRPRVVFACECREIKVAADEADDFEGLDCRHCGHELERGD